VAPREAPIDPEWRVLPRWKPRSYRRPAINFVVANWLGHITPKPDQPHLVEFTPDNQEVRRWGDQTLARPITSVYVFR